jgi:hypothetical protein
MLGQGVDRFEAVVLARAVPVREQLVPVKLRPFTDEAECAGGDCAGQDRSVDADRRPLSGVLGVKVGDSDDLVRASTSR